MFIQIKTRNPKREEEHCLFLKLPKSLELVLNITVQVTVCWWIKATTFPEWVKLLCGEIGEGVLPTERVYFDWENSIFTALWLQSEKHCWKGNNNNEHYIHCSAYSCICSHQWASLPFFGQLSRVKQYHVNLFYNIRKPSLYHCLLYYITHTCGTTSSHLYINQLP